jgi:tyrocidine synthetase III
MRDNNIIGNQAAAAAQNLEARDYWLNKLEGELVKTMFPREYKNENNSGQSPPFETISFEFTGELFQQLMKLSNGFDYTLHMILTAAVALLLEKYTGSKDIIVGAPIYKQEVNASFINTILAIRAQIEPQMTFKELLMQVRQTFLEATENQNYPIETLLYQLNIESNPDEFPLFDIAVLLENIHDKDYFRDIPINMFFSFLRTETGISGKVEYNPMLYDGIMIDRSILHLKYFMQTALFNIDAKAKEVEILSGEEKRQVLHDFNDTRNEYPADKTLVDLFEAQVAREPEATALWFDGKQMSYDQLDQKSYCLSRLLIKKGINAETIVGLMVERSFEMVIGMLGIMRAGGAYLPMASQHPEERLKYMLQDSGAQLLLTQQHLLDLFTFDVEAIELTDETIYSTAPVIAKNECEPPIRPNQLAYMIYTSGSTGKAKGVAVEHGSIVNTLQWRKNYYEFGPKDVILQILGFTFDSSVEDIFTTLISGGALVLVPQASVYDLTYLKKLIIETGVTYFLIVPGFYKSFLEEIPDALKGLRAITVAADNITEKLVKHHFQVLENVKLYNEYGPTENSVCSTVYQFSPTRTKVLIGKPIDNVSCYILNTHGQPNPIGVPGELCVSGKGLVRGYWQRPQLSKEKFVDNPFFRGERIYRTGDLAKWMKDGNIQFLGRIDFQVKIRGFRIELGEIESRILEYEGIKEAVVTAVEGASEDEKYLCAYIVSETEIDAARLKENLMSTLPDYMIPALFMQLDHLPLSANGKVDRKALPKPEVDNQEEYVAPENEKEVKLTEIWCHVLGLKPEQVGIDSGFFNLGGHSLSATILVSKIHKEFNVKIPLNEIFNSPTIRQLAAIIEESVKSQFTSIEPVKEKEYYKVSSSQNRLYILQQMDLSSTAYNVPLVFEVEGELCKEKLAETFKKLVQRHESMRTSFTIVNDTPVQKIYEYIELDIEYHDISHLNDRSAADNRQYQEEVKDITRRFIRPFDLSEKSLIRFGLIKIDSLRQILMIDLHHIITDLISHTILINDIMLLYNDVELPGLKLQYKDYSEWQQSEPVKEALKKQEEFWLAEFNGDIPILNLPTDYIRPSTQSFAGNNIEFESNPQETAALKEIARSEEGTLFMILLAIYNIFLSKISGQEDIIIGTPVASRRHADLEKINGMFVNTIALRNCLSGKKHFITFFKELRERTLSAFENQDYLFEDLVEKVDVIRDVSRNPIFDVLFSYQSGTESLDAITTEELQDFKIKPFAYEHNVSKFDLTLRVVEHEERLCFSMEYSSSLFEQNTIHRFIEFFKKITASIASDPKQTLAGIEIIPREEKNQVLYEFNDTQTVYPKEKTIDQLFAEQVEKSPESISLVGPSLSGSQADESLEKFTYREVQEKSARLSHHLKLQGVQPNTIVAISMEHSIELILGILAILNAGAAYLPIDPEYPQERIDYMINDSAAKMMVTGREITDWLNSSTPTSLLSSNPNPVTAHSLVYVIYTSGTTGKPKGTLLENRNLVNYVSWFGKKAKLTGNDRTLLTSSFCFDLGYTAIYPSLLSGCQLHIIDREQYLSMEILIAYIIHHNISYLKITPSLFSAVIESSDFRKVKDSSLRLVVLGGEKIKIKDVETFHAMVPGVGFINHYGPTEATIGCVAQEIDFNHFEMYRERPLIGHPIHNMKVLILDNNLGLVPVGIPGELCVSGSGVARGYLNRPVLTAEKFVEQVATVDDKHSREKSHTPGMPPISPIYRTGDLARWVEGGAIEFLGRIDNQVKIRGYRVETGEIENRLLQHEGIKEAAVISRESSPGDAYICAYIVWKRDHPKDSEDHSLEIKEFLSGKLPEYMIPAYFVIMDRIPLTANRKLNRKLLPEPQLKMDGYTAPRNSIEEKCAEIWSQLLNIDSATEFIGIDDNFFQRGGHSLSAAIMTARIHKEFSIKIPLSEIFKTPTIRGMAKYINQAVKDNFNAIEPVGIKEYYALSPAQKRLYVVQQINPDSIGYNMPSSYIVEGNVDLERFLIAFKELIKRHDSLRTSFIMVGDEPVQRILQEVDFQVEYYDVSQPGSGAIASDGQREEDSSAFIENFIRPFDLAKAPMMRASLIKRQEKEYIFIVDMHHIITDGVSNAILNRDFIMLYAKQQLPPLKLQYKDFSEWQSTAVKKELIQKQEEYWLQKFEGEIPIINLPYDYEKPEKIYYEGNMITFIIPLEMAQNVNHLNRETGSTLFMFLLTAFNTLLFLYTGDEDIIIGSPITGRNHIDLQNIIGMFVNMLALRNKPQGNKTFREFFMEVKQNIMEAFENQDYQFDELVRKVGVQRKSDRNPLFNTVLAVHNIDVTETDRAYMAHGDDLKLKPYVSDSIISRFDLTFIASEFDGGIRILNRYSTALFKEETMKRFGEHYIEIIQQVTANPDIKLEEIILSSGFLQGSHAIEENDVDFDF